MRELVLCCALYQMWYDVLSMANFDAMYSSVRSQQASLGLLMLWWKTATGSRSLSQSLQVGVVEHGFGSPQAFLFLTLLQCLLNESFILGDISTHQRRRRSARSGHQIGNRHVDRSGSRSTGRINSCWSARSGRHPEKTRNGTLLTSVATGQGSGRSGCQRSSGGLPVQRDSRDTGRR